MSGWLANGYGPLLSAAVIDVVVPKETKYGDAAAEAAAPPPPPTVPVGMRCPPGCGRGSLRPAGVVDDACWVAALKSPPPPPKIVSRLAAVPYVDEAAPAKQLSEVRVDVATPYVDISGCTPEPEIPPTTSQLSFVELYKSRPAPPEVVTASSTVAPDNDDDGGGTETEMEMEMDGGGTCGGDDTKLPAG